MGGSGGGPDGRQRRRPGGTAAAKETRRDGGGGGPDGMRSQTGGLGGSGGSGGPDGRQRRRPRGTAAAEEARKDGDGGDPFKQILAIPALIAKCQFKNNLNVKCRRGRAHTQRHGGKKQMPNSEYMYQHRPAPAQI